MIEPVLGSGGCVAPPDAFWPALTELCAEHGWLLCADEVKTGFGRSGHLFAVQRWGVEPDLMCLGKALGGGVAPIGAVLGSERALGGFDDVPTGSTWSWLPWAAAAALATIGVYEREPVLENVRELRAGRRASASAPSPSATPASARSARSAASRRSSWSATARRRSATASCRTRPGSRRCAAASSPTRARPRSTSSPRC